ncbi:MAG: lipopolysaccharide heptosyltransferase II [Deltaproteobacteria bacterium RIFCSPLOWO2_12_FULL_43_16]|nr:MAG: lipopolysaccharide heptosyltransferase II [Deltaproteobacteria bacterium GWA2_43_19]OGQ09439.1 MAG: lipopolysaccharide heptosyltransferase II [Deltaproteobacteria bacterium RIFCSPHIGHO2_02_FULL_43_33]OGQ58077.1 MAG: lipopolysaccharide heptosyltransferase II [Deltaproteobacteria bacterium RIFCSPLOWO2_12_FULL_43_16]HBR17446.1 lipopolysaccharide heptosyltransferase II [Deltaproteobacteria bacterium]
MGFNNVLIIKLGAIGDLLMTTPAIRALKKAYPATHISLLVGKSSKMAVSGNPHIDELIECDDYIIYKAGFLQKARYALSLLYLLRKKKFDTVIVFHRDWQFNFFVFLCGIPERIGFDRNGEGRFLTRRIEINGVRHQIDHYLEIVKSFGIHDDGRAMDFAISKDAESLADKILRTGGVGKGDIVIGILAGGASNIKTEMPIKRWPLENYIELSNKMIADGYKIILLGAEGDKPNAEAILKKSTVDIIDLTGKATLEETAAVMKRCNVIVTHDSGPMHLASAVGRPVVSIFGPTDPKEYYPLSSDSHYFWNVENIECAPCYEDGRFPDCNDPICMKAVTVEQVYEKVKDIISARGR